MSEEVQLVYDRSCPVCEFYSTRVDVDESSGHLERIDARQPGELMDEITARGLDIDEGMVLKVGDDLYYGADAIHELARLGSKQGFFNRIASAVFASRRRAAWLYPLLKRLRNLLLRLLGRSRINNLGRRGNERF